MAEIEVGAFELICDALSRADVRVQRIRGVERMSSPYRFVVDAHVERATHGDVTEDLIGARASLRLRVGGPERLVHGVVDRADVEAEPRTTRDRLRLVLVPSFARLRRRKQSRVFQGMSAPEIVEQVLRERRVPVALALSGAYAKRDLCVQYMESDLSFVERLLAEEGIFYAFDHPADAAAEVLRVGDGGGSIPPIAGDARVAYRPTVGLGELGVEVTRLVVGRRSASAKVVLREFDFERPSFDLEAQASFEGRPEGDGSEELEIYEHHGEHGGLDVHPVAARRRLGQARRRAAWIEGSSGVSRLEAGAAFTLTEGPRPSDDGTYTLLQVEHDGRVAEAAGDARTIYENTFHAIPSAVLPRPRARHRKVHETTLTAKVVGPAGQEIHTDAHGRIRVQFHWDREGKQDERSSCWIRVAQTWSGVGWGFQFIPRVGMEVIVTFVGGDPDRPLVIGAVPNAEHPVPFPLPQSKTKSGIRTHSSRGGGGYHELSFEDRAGHELVTLRSQRDLDEHVLHDQFSQIDRDKVTRVGHDYTTEVGANRNVVVHGSDVRAVAADRTSTTGGSERAVVEGNVTVDVRGTRTDAVAGARFDDVGGSRQTITRGRSDVHIGGDARVDVGGDASTHTEGRHTLSAGGDVVVAGLRRVDVSGKAVAIHAETHDVTSRLELDATAGVRLTTDKVIELRADERLSIRVGETRIDVSRDGIDLDAKKVSIGGEVISLTTPGGSLSIAERIAAFAKELFLSSSAKATLELGAAARLDGATISLGGAQAAEKEARELRREQARTAAKSTLHLFDRGGHPATGVDYRVTMPGFVKEGHAPNGTVEIPAFPGVATALVEWGTPAAERAPGESAARYPFSTEVYLLADTADPDETLRRKLSNLGHRGPHLASAVASAAAHAGVERSSARALVDDHHGRALPVRKPT